MKYIVSLLILFCTGLAHSWGIPKSYVDSLKQEFYSQKDKTPIQQYTILYQIAFKSSDADSIIYYSNLAIQLDKKFNLNQSRALSLNGLGHLERGELVIALERFMESAKLNKELNNLNNLATVYNYISDVYNRQHNWSNAIFYQKKAIQIMRSKNHPFKLASFINNLGYTYYEHQLYDSSLTYYTEALHIYDSIQHEI
ncbi:MAG: tetratricopeptide repeat protein, partial [Bacteroidales bacterium]|nr:tetratricopeptide repeat protein [Bacteroidales bacterium]